MQDETRLFVYVCEYTNTYTGNILPLWYFILDPFLLFYYIKYMDTSLHETHNKYYSLEITLKFKVLFLQVLC